MKTIAAVVHEKDAPFSLEEVELDDLRDDEVLVRMVATGLCHTDLSVRAGVIPFPLPASWDTRARVWSRRSVRRWAAWHPATTCWPRSPPAVSAPTAAAASPPTATASCR